MSVSLIGGLGLTLVRVYQQRPAPDGLLSGAPHIHAITDEAYYVVKGRGHVEMHDMKHGFRTVPLEVGTYVDFQPCILHRLVSADGLEVLGLMGNAGLAEAGDARIYFGAAVDADPALYNDLGTLASRRGLDGALERRDLAVQAYLGLMALWRNDRAEYFMELGRFNGASLAAAAGKRTEFSGHIERGPLAAGGRTRERLDHLPTETSSLVTRLQTLAETPVLGMCGELFPVLQPVSLE